VIRQHGRKANAQSGTFGSKNPFILLIKTLMGPLVYGPCSATTKPNPEVLINQATPWVCRNIPARRRATTRAGVLDHLGS
jgi:hypothetical protein